MEGRITYLLFMFTVGRIVVQTVCNSRKMFTCGKYAPCTIVTAEGKLWFLKLSDLQIDLFDHAMFSRENFSCLFRIYEHVCR